MMVFYSLFVLLVIVALSSHVVNLQRITNLYVPRRASNRVEIDCKYDVEGKKLYDVKWYKDGQQFLRCAGDGTVNRFEVEGVTIDPPKFASVGACPVTLIVLTKKASGEYKCEVTLDIPGFPMAWDISRLDYLVPARNNGSSDKVPQGSEKHTSEEVTEAKSGSAGLSTNNIALFLIMYFIFT